MSQRDEERRAAARERMRLRRAALRAAVPPRPPIDPASERIVARFHELRRATLREVRG